MKNTAVQLIFLTLLFIINYDLLFADTLILKSGKVIECKILEKNQDYIKIEYAGGPLYYERKYIKQANEEFLQPKEDTSQQPISAEQWSKGIVAEKGLKSRNSGIKAVILASVSQGASPLRVFFNGLKSFSPAGKIVSYYWDLGDGDTLSMAKVKNTYISMSYGPRIYTVQLTVMDEKGNIASESTNISVTNKNL